MIRDYDQAVQCHCQNVAESAGLLPSSTMADLVTRERETQAILQFVERSLGRRRAEGDQTPATIVDVGCGNGYTLSVLASRWPDERFVASSVPTLCGRWRPRASKATIT